MCHERLNCDQRLNQHPLNTKPTCIWAAVAIKLSRNDPKKRNINNKFEYTRCILPDIGALDPDQAEEEEDEKMNQLVNRLREEVQKKPKRYIKGTRKYDFPEGCPED